MKISYRWPLAILLIAGLIFSLLPSAKSAPKLEVVKFVPVFMDFSQVQMPADATTAIEAQGSALYLNEGKTRVVFWKEDNTVQVTGYQTSNFTCSLGVVYVQFDGWHVYYDCTTGRIVASRVAYPTDVMGFSNTTVPNLDWKPIDNSTQPYDGWNLIVSADGRTLKAISPLGQELLVTTERVVVADTLSVVNGLPSAAWLLQIGRPIDVLVIVVRPTESGWSYAVP